MNDTEEIDLLKVSIIKRIPDDPYKRQIVVDDFAKTTINVHDLCVICATIIDVYLLKAEEKYQIEDENYLMRTLPILIKTRHALVEKQN